MGPFREGWAVCGLLAFCLFAMARRVPRELRAEVDLAKAKAASESCLELEFLSLSRVFPVELVLASLMSARPVFFLVFF